ncbi:relaxase domain-containing protein [Demequina litorisediminis]|uniref:TrwC relaxase domain-containing protein n=1 Tax=Demequina litorisediminis TaxID=1849022 RepID=A0ABQ6IJC9_9MICO|nr:relaxase domain-containing protein [Demequina litorisediminis]GMA37826.1 hypothetical protein GCM10025876_40300 [Demequina litorisediminis]
MESRLTRELGVTFEDVYTARGGQAVREIVGIDKGVREAFSSRTRDIGAHLDALVAEYTTTYGRAPSKATMRRLAQQATLATRPAKESGETLGEQREQWAGRARELLGRRSAVRKMTAGVVAGPRKPAPFTLTVDQVDGLARAVVEDLGQKRARWNSANVTATTERLLRDYLSPNADLKSRMEHFAGGSAAGTLADLEDLDATIREVVAATEHHSIDLSMPDLLNTPDVLRRRDRTVVFGPAHAKWRTSEAVLARETRLLEAAETAWGPVFDAANVDLLSRMRTRPLDEGQARRGATLHRVGPSRRRGYWSCRRRQDHRHEGVRRCREHRRRPRRCARPIGRGREGTERRGSRCAPRLWRSSSTPTRGVASPRPYGLTHRQSF